MFVILKPVGRDEVRTETRLTSAPEKGDVITMKGPNRGVEYQIRVKRVEVRSDQAVVITPYKHF